MASLTMLFRCLSILYFHLLNCIKSGIWRKTSLLEVFSTPFQGRSCNEIYTVRVLFLAHINAVISQHDESHELIQNRTCSTR